MMPMPRAASQRFTLSSREHISRAPPALGRDFDAYR